MSIRMNSDTVDWTWMGFIMLNDFFSSDVMHGNVFWFCSWNNALFQRVKDGLCNRIFKAIILLNTFFALYIPYHHLFILTSWNYCCHVTWKLWCCDPIGMSDIGTFELKCCNIPNFHAFIIARWKYQVSIWTEANWSNCSCMSFYSLCFSGSPWIP